MQLKVNSVWVQNIPLLKVIRSSRNIFFGYFFIRNLFFFLENAYSSILSSKNTNTTICISWQMFPIQAQLVKVWECLDLQLQRLRLVYFRDKNRRDKESVFLFPRIIRSFPRMFDFRLKLSRKRSTDSTKRGKRSLSDFSKSILYRKRWCCSTRPLVTVHFPLLVFPATSFFSHLDLLLPPSLLSSLSLSSFLGLLLSILFARPLHESFYFLLCARLKTCEAVKLERFVSAWKALWFDIKFSTSIHLRVFLFLMEFYHLIIH